MRALILAAMLLFVAGCAPYHRYSFSGLGPEQFVADSCLCGASSAMFVNPDESDRVAACMAKMGWHVTRVK